MPDDLRARLEGVETLTDGDRESDRRTRPTRARRTAVASGIGPAAMSETMAGLRRKINSAQELQSVVRTMKALAASNIGQYEQSVRALADYYRTVALGLGACLRISEPAGIMADGRRKAEDAPVAAVVFGSDQGLVGRFNDVLVEHALKTLATLPVTARIWAVGERVHARLADAGLSLMGVFVVPNSAKTIAPLVGRILLESELARCTR